MSDDEQIPDNVIPFPGKKREEVTHDLSTLVVSHQSIQDLIVMAACVNLSTSQEGSMDPECLEAISDQNFPCSENCGCYSHMLSSMALELVFEGPKQDEARDQLYREYAALIKKDDE